MSACVQCGLHLSGDQALCPHHHKVYGDDGWGTANRLICNLIHRGVIPKRLKPEDRDDQFWAGVNESYF